MAAKKKPNARQRVFVKEYVWGEHCGNGGKCMHLAGFTVKDVCSGAYQLLRRPAVKAAIEAELAKKEELVKLKALRVAEDQYLLATSDIGDAFASNGELLPVGDGFLAADGKPLRMPEAVRRAVASVEVETRQDGRGDDAETYTVTKVKLHDKRGAAELFLKWAGKLKDKIEVEGGLTLDQLVPRRKPPEET